MTCVLPRTDCDRNHDHYRHLAGRIAVAICLMLLGACGRGGPAEQPTASSEPEGNRPVSLAPPSEDAETTDQIQLYREITRPVPDQLKVTVQVRYGGNQPVTALGIVENLPPGWSFGQAGGSHPPQITPPPGQIDHLEFVWITTPPFPFSFTYTLAKNMDGPESNISIRGQAVYRRLGGEEHSRETATPIPPGSSAVQ